MRPLRRLLIAAAVMTPAAIMYTSSADAQPGVDASGCVKCARLNDSCYSGYLSGGSMCVTVSPCETVGSCSVT